MLGLQVGVHSTTVLLIPGIVLLFWLNSRTRTTHYSPAVGGLRSAVTPLLLFIFAATAYLYVPLRAEWLIARYGREGAIAHGLLADFYHSGLAGWLRYFTAGDFTGGVVSNWGKVPEQLISVYLLRLLPIDFRTFTWPALGMGFAGALAILLWPPLRRRAWPFLLLYAVPIPFVLTYGQGEQNAFLLTSNLAFSLFVGAFLAWLFTVISRFSRFRDPSALFRTGPAIESSESRVADPLRAKESSGGRRPAAGGLLVLIFALFLIIPYQQAQYNINRFKHKWDTSHYDYWADVLNHPLEKGAGVMANWGDLTSMWYMQHVENRRPDLLGVYPADEDVAAAWLAQGRSLYIAGPVMGKWEPGVMERYQVIPWGRLVRLAPLDSDPLALLPEPSQPQSPVLSAAKGAVFDGKVRLLGADFAPAVDSGGVLYVNMSWQALADLPPLSRYSLRLIQGDGVIAQKDDTLRSGWFPLDYLPAGQPFVGAYPLQTPPGALPGDYRLQLAVYEKARREWPLADGSLTLDLGAVEVKFAPAATPPGVNRFNGEISLDNYDFKVKRVGQGKGFPLRLLWRALETPQDDYTLLVELVDRAGRVWRDWRQAVETTSWRPGQQVRQQVDLTVPAEAPTGEDALSVRLSWLRPDGSRLPVRRWILPAGDSLDLGAPAITPKKNRSFEKPAMQNETAINFDHKAALIGYDLPATISPSSLSLTLYWQGLGEMRYSYAVFVHLVDSAGNVVAQQDAVPGERGKQPTTSWAVGEIVADPVEIPLPPDLPPGEYAVVVGLYLPPDGPRLLRLDDAGQPAGDSAVVGLVKIAEGK